jgi:hypothetical protein
MLNKLSESSAREAQHIFSEFFVFLCRVYPPEADTKNILNRSFIP